MLEYFTATRKKEAPLDVLICNKDILLSEKNQDAE